MCARVSVCVCVCTHRHQHVALLLFKLCRRLLLPLRLILIKAIAIESSRESHRLDKRAKHTDTRTHTHAQFLNDLETVTGFFRPTSTYVSPSVCVCVCAYAQTVTILGHFDFRSSSSSSSFRTSLSHGLITL